MAFLINSLTLSRIVLSPLIFILIVFFESFLFSLMLVISCGLADYLDGYLARRNDLSSKLGAMLDPIADKILIVFCFIALTIHFDSNYLAFVTSIIICREVWVSGLRDYNAQNNNFAATKVTFLSKSKTTIQISVICLYLLGLLMNQKFLILVSDFSLFLALLITIKTGLDYTHKSKIFS